jgi:hypothetical protein
MNYGKTAGQTLLLPIYMHLLSRNPDYGLGYPQKSKKVVRPLPTLSIFPPRTRNYSPSWRSEYLIPYGSHKSKNIVRPLAGQKSKKTVRPFLPKFTKNLDILPIIKYSNG